MNSFDFFLLGLLVGMIFAILLKAHTKTVTVKPRPECDFVPLFKKEEIEDDLEKHIPGWKMEKDEETNKKIS
jgi:hypothetical protein